MPRMIGRQLVTSAYLSGSISGTSADFTSDSKTGDSSTFRRTTKPTRISSAEQRNGSRQAHSRRASSPKVERMLKKPVARSAPAGLPS